MHHVPSSILCVLGTLPKIINNLRFLHGFSLFQQPGVLGFTVGHLLGICRRSYFAWPVGLFVCRVQGEWMTWMTGLCNGWLVFWRPWNRVTYVYGTPSLKTQNLSKVEKRAFRSLKRRLFSALKLWEKCLIWADQLFCFKTFFQKILSHFSTVDSGSLNRW